MPLPAPPRCWRWFCAAYAIFRQKPVLICAALMFYFSFSTLLSTLPRIGSVLSTLLMPCFTVSLMNIVRQPRPTLPDIFQPFRERLKPLLCIALILMLYMTLALGLITLLDPEFARALGQPDALEAFFNPKHFVAILSLFILLTPLFMAYWFAPLLVAWRQFPVAKAMFFSFMTTLRNWRAILGCVLLLGLLCFTALILLVLVAAISPNLAHLLLLMVLVTSAAINLCLTCVIYRELFPTTTPRHPRHISEIA
jgi:hypothetical protein